MIEPVKLARNSIVYKSKQEHQAENGVILKKEKPESRILPNTLGTRWRQKYQKTLNAFLEYPFKGFKGDVNSDFYEFLSMGIVPYLAGSAMFITMFNLLRNLTPESQRFANIKGNKMGLGVILFGVMKTLANDLVTRPVALATGIDIEHPIEHVYYPLPKEPGEAANIMPQIQQRKIYDSREFFRKDLIQKDIGFKYYDRIAKKIGLGENLNDSVTETTPIIQSVVSTTKTAKSLSSYAWAGVGVGLAAQDAWLSFFKSMSNRKHYTKNSDKNFLLNSFGHIKTFWENAFDITKEFGKSFLNSFKTLWTGEAGTTGFRKHAGKSWLMFTAALTAGSVANVIIRARNMGKLANKDIIDKSKESMEI